MEEAFTLSPFYSRIPVDDRVLYLLAHYRDAKFIDQVTDFEAALRRIRITFRAIRNAVHARRARFTATHPWTNSGFSTRLEAARIVLSTVGKTLSRWNGRIEGNALFSGVGDIAGQLGKRHRTNEKHAHARLARRSHVCRPSELHVVDAARRAARMSEPHVIDTAASGQ
ncbi:hypothetical protein ACFFYR_26440 [Paraburkholderia dipogonis]|uniref:hypothetical protein n=1 Tax=Paraburkholderia dipogonis TaxID=1211383 RepID=UPI00141BD54D|nr:hypothetical protein [Paraburkholderia dipogonis]